MLVLAHSRIKKPRIVCEMKKKEKKHSIAARLWPTLSLGSDCDELLLNLIYC